MKRFIKETPLPIIIIPLILFAPLFLTGKALVWGTVSTQFIPWWDFAWDTLMQGQIPLWNPWVGMGAPLVANYQSAIFYPPYWILLIIYALAGIKWMSWGLTFIVAFHLIWSGLGLAKLLDEVGLGKLAQTVGGLAFSLCGYLVARAGFLSINAAAAWLPWLLFYGLRVVRSKKMAFWMLSTVIAFQLLAGHAQTAWYSILLTGIWILYWSVINFDLNYKLKNIWKSVSKFILAGLLGAGLSAIQLIPTVEYLLQSQRSGEYGYAEAMTYSFWPWRFLTLLVPNLFGNPATGNYWGYGNFWEDAVYIGLLPILIAAGAVIRAIFNKNTSGDTDSAGRRNLVVFLSGIVIISFLFALGDNTFIFPFLYRNVPTFGLFQAPTRFNLWAEISLSILAGVGIEQLTRPAGKRTYWTRLAAAGCFSVMIGALLGWTFLPEAKSTFFIPIGLAGALGLGTSLLILFQPAKYQKKKYETWSVLLVLLVAVDLIIAGWGLNPGVRTDFYEMEREVTGEGRTFIAENLEYDLKFNKYFKFDTFYPGVPWDDMHQDLIPNLPILQRKSMVNNFDPLVPGRFQTWLDEYNEIIDIANHQMTRLMNISQIITQNNDQIQKINNEFVSAIRINNLVKISSDEQEILSEVINQNYDFINSMILTSSPSAKEADCEIQGDGKISINEEHPGSIKFTASLDKNSWVIWSQHWYPGWIAIIDGEEKIEIERANYLFQAVCIPEGEHVVEIVYRPLSFFLGVGVTFISLAFVITGMIVTKKEKLST